MILFFVFFWEWSTMANPQFVVCKAHVEGRWLHDFHAGKVEHRPVPFFSVSEDRIPQERWACVQLCKYSIVMHNIVELRTPAMPVGGRGRERERGISSELADMTCCELHLRCRHRHCRRRCRCCRRCCCCFWSSFSFSFLFLFVLSLSLSLSLLSLLSSLSSLSSLSLLSSSSSSSASSSSALSSSSLLLLLLL